jgi:hypothetical protein
MVTLAPAIAAPVKSLTEPAMALVVSPWAQSESGASMETAKTGNSGNRSI